MSDSPNFALLLERVSAYLEKAEAKGTKEKRDLKMAQQALAKIVEILYGKTAYRCNLHPLQDGERNH